MGSSQKPTILVVEDEKFVRMVAVEALEDSGFQVLDTGSAVEALDIMASHEVSVLFTDIQMPGPIDGLELADIVAVRHPRVKLIVTSGMMRPDDTDIPDNGIFLPKPYLLNDLSSIIEKQLG